MTPPREISTEALPWSEELLDMAVSFITSEMIGNEIGFPKYPKALLPLIAQQLVEDPKMGWPDFEGAVAWLKESFDWAEW